MQVIYFYGTQLKINIPKLTCIWCFIVQGIRQFSMEKRLNGILNKVEITLLLHYTSSTWHTDDSHVRDWWNAWFWCIHKGTHIHINESGHKIISYWSHFAILTILHTQSCFYIFRTITGTLTFPSPHEHGLVSRSKIHTSNQWHNPQTKHTSSTQTPTHPCEESMFPWYCKLMGNPSLYL